MICNEDFVGLNVRLFCVGVFIVQFLFVEV